MKFEFNKINSRFQNIKCSFRHKPVNDKLHLFTRKFKNLKFNFKKKTFKNNLAEACPGVQIGDVGVSSYRGRGAYGSGVSR